MGKTFITADTHFGHKDMIGFCNRPFKTVEKMDRALIRNWNERVKEKDTVIFLGDFAFKECNKVEYYIERLNGNKIFVKGNHDRNNGLKTKIENLVLRNGNNLLFCVHDPRHINRDITINLVAHVHLNWRARWIRWNDTQKANILINVGVDWWKFYPLELQEIIAYVQHIKKNFPMLRYNYNDWIKPFDDVCKGQCGYNDQCKECEKNVGVAK